MGLSYRLASLKKIKRSVPRDNLWLMKGYLLQLLKKVHRKFHRNDIDSSRRAIIDILLEITELVESETSHLMGKFSRGRNLHDVWTKHSVQHVAVLT